MSFKENAFDWLEEVIAPALDKIYEEEIGRDLIVRDLNERTIVAIFHCKANALLVEKQNLNSALSHLVMDVEYNRNFLRPKNVFEKCKSCGKDLCIVKMAGLEVKPGIPDVVIHQRGGNEDNQAVIEFKKYQGRRKWERDKAKLSYFSCRQPSKDGEVMDYQYRVGYLIVLSDTEWSVQVFEDAALKGTKRRREGRWL